uniref:Uncharacterized protein n=1 Tax=viral metagenome TaxID=1070528 RepID=A0A6C0CD55_9ZZZZ
MGYLEYECSILGEYINTRRCYNKVVEEINILLI